METYQIEQRVQIDFSYQGNPPRVYAKQYDNNMRVVAIDLYNNGQPYTVPEGYSVNIRLDKLDGHHVYNPALFGTGNTVFAILTQQMLANNGELLAEIEVIQGEHTLKTATFIVSCAPSAVPPGEIESSDEYKTVQEIAKQVENAAKIVTDNEEAIKAIPGQIEDIQGLVEEAEAARDNAANSAADALQSVTDAAAQVKAAEVEAAKAATSATLAADSEDKARQYAEQAGSISTGSKGFFDTPDALRATYPTGENGWFAIVGTTDTVWLWDSDSSQWKDTSQGINLQNYPTWSALRNKLLVPCICTYNAETHVFSLTRRDVNQLLQDGAELTFHPTVDYTQGDKVEFEGAAVPLEYAGSPVDVQSGAWLANRPAKLIWYADNEQGGTPNEPLRARRRTRS